MTDKKSFIWFDGKMVSHEKAQVQILNHSLHYGSAVFEGIRCYDAKMGPVIFRPKDHVKRFFYSASAMGMKISFSQKEIYDAIRKTVEKNNLKECYIRPIAFYGGKMGLFPVGAPLHVAIAAWPWAKYLDKESVRVNISSYSRLHRNSTDMAAKISGHYANSIIASLESKKLGFDEALPLDEKGMIAEGPGENIFFVKKNTIFTPKTGAILPGITRESVMKIAGDFGYKVLERNIRPRDLKNFEEAFFTGTAVEVNAIGQIEKVKYGKGKEGEVTRKIKETYLQTVHGKIDRYAKWLDYVK